MKKIGKIKKLGLAVTATAVSFAVLGTGLAFARPASVIAADAVNAGGAVGNSVTLAKDIPVPTKAEYGKPFSVPSAESGMTVTVTAPDGNEVAVTGGEVVAKQLGNYVVTYGDADGAAYSFNVYVTLGEDYFLKVDYNGADIPTYIERGKTFTLPGADIVYYDENKMLQSYPDFDPETNLNVTVSTSTDTFKPGDEVTASSNGKLFVTYSAQVEGGAKFFNQTFTVNVQTSVTDSEAPLINISGVPGTISLNNAVTLPKATATDNYDSNIKIVIEVTDPDGKPVRTVDVNKYGYGERDADKNAADLAELEKSEPDLTKLNYPYVAFDNDQAMTFYPLTAGQYKVKYVAYDDNKPNANASTARTFTMTCSDSSAPVFEEIAEDAIPSTWGLTVKNADGTLSEADTRIKIPMPFLVDNKDHMFPNQTQDGEEADTDLIKLYFRITDSDYSSRTIVEFTNILQTVSEKSSEYTYKSKGVYGEKDEEFVFNADNDFYFDFSEYNRTDNSDKPVDLPGTYTVYYRAEDKAGNRSTKSYTITLEDTYEDKDAPTIGDLNLPNYVAFADESMTIPAPQVGDTDPRPSVEYRIYSDNGLTGAENDVDEKAFLKVEGGEKAEFVYDDAESKYFLVVDKDKSYERKLELGEKLYFCVTAKDSVGNVSGNVKDTVTDFTGFTIDNYAADCDDVVSFISEAITNNITYSDSGIVFKVNDAAVSASNVIHADDKVTVNGFDIEFTSADMRKYVGFEVRLTDAKGAVLNTALETYTDDSKIHVKNLTFTPSAGGDHFLYVRAFDVNGKSTVISYKIPVADRTTGGGTASAVSIPTSGSVNVKYTLHNDTATELGGNTSSTGTYYIARKISGGAFSLMGSEFVAYSQGSYSFTDGYVDNDASDYEFNILNKSSNYGITVKDTASPVIEVQGAIPSYAVKSTKEEKSYVLLPIITAYTENGNATVTVDVKFDKDGKAADVKLVDDDVLADETYDGVFTADDKGKYFFEGAKDGMYTVSVTAANGSVSATPYTASIAVGDVVGPEFTVTGGSSGRMKQGDTFTYGTMTIDSTLDGDGTGVTITKKLIDPSKEEVAGATVSGSYKSYNDEANNGTAITLDKSGAYEVVYTAQDAVGNVTTQRFTINVSASGSSTPTTFTTLSTVLIVVAVVLLAGVIVYVVRFRKVKK